MSARRAQQLGSPSGLRVAVLVDLLYEPGAGGHVRSWERLAQAAAGLDGEAFDLTVHYAGSGPKQMDLAPHVRLQLHRPVFSTRSLSFLSHVPDHTDLAPYHSALAKALAGADVLHTTDGFFAFAQTAERLARRRGVPLVNSVHTDTPSYARLFTRKTIERMVGTGALARLLLDRWQLDLRQEESMLRRLACHQGRCTYALVSQPVERARALTVLAPGQVRTLRRGIDKQAFHPAHRDRAWLRGRFGIPEDRVLVLAVGRVNAGKNIMTLATAVRQAIDGGAPLHLLCAGKGDDRGAVLDLLGEQATCPGVVEPPELMRVYASADIFALASEIEVFANVVQEALASGLPTLVAAAGGMGGLIAEGDTGFILPGTAPQPWAAALALLAGDPERRRRMGAAARAFAEARLPSWTDILREDLVPVWRAAAAGGLKLSGAGRGR